LRTLNVSENSNLPGVPPTLAHVRTLETIILDVDKIKFPPKGKRQKKVNMHVSSVLIMIALSLVV